MKNLWELFNYKTPIKYFINKPIREYDLSKANISALLYMKRISLSQYNSYIAMPKLNREIIIGKWIKKDPSVYQDIQSGIIFAKKQFILSNHIKDEDIIAIHNDSIIFVGNQAIIETFDPFIFRLEKTYSSFLQLQNLEIYYSFNPFETDNLTVKGLKNQNNALLDEIKYVCCLLQQRDVREVLDRLHWFYEDFINRRLSKEFYRTLDNTSGYILHTLAHTVVLDDIDDELILDVDINRNLSILRDLIAIVSNIYKSN